MSSMPTSAGSSSEPVKYRSSYAYGLKGFKPLTVQQVIGRFRREKPSTADEALHNCRVPMQYMFSGAFRHVYHLVGTPIVAKFPHYDDCREGGYDHSAAEVRWVRRLRSNKYSDLHPYLPRIYYFDRKHGVVLMHKYKELEHTKTAERLCAKLGERLTRVLDLYEEPDIKPDNMGRDEKGNIVILDLGLFSG